MRDDLRAFFNERAPIWDSMQVPDEEKIEGLLRMLAIPKGGVILDVGSGTGVLIPFLRKIFSPSLIVELDIAERMLEVAKSKHGEEGISYVWGDAESVDLKETFDAVICYSSFPHFTDKRRAIENLVRFLKERGIFAVIHSSGREAIHRIHSLNEVTRNDLLPSAQDLAELFEESGLRVIISDEDEERYIVAGVKL